jgi:uncharacterized protein Smg (DUF494 family)
MPASHGFVPEGGEKQMKEKLVELLVHIMSEMQANSPLNEADLGALKEKGYTASEISEALSWLHDNRKLDSGMITVRRPSSTGSRRVFHEVEKQAFTTESQGYLIQLRELGLLDDRDVEIVIERAMMTGYERLSVEEVREIVASLLFGKGGTAQRSFLNSRDAIH